MIGIVDSGSTKTDWLLVGQSGNRHVRTAGMNPYFQTADEMAEVLRTQLVPSLEDKEPMEAIFFYGAGCASEAVNQKVEQAIARFFPTTIEVQSDLMAAARALCGRNAGIACILGTGSNSCAFDGEHIVEQVSPLGYVLGDEGSGAVLGKRLVGDVVKHQLSSAVETLFYEETELTPALILDKVYRQPFPNRFLASLVPFIKRHIDDPSLQRLVEDNFRLFFMRNVMNYTSVKSYPIHFVGSIAYHFQSQLIRVVEQQGLRMGTIMQSPMEGLVRYHLPKFNSYKI